MPASLKQEFATAEKIATPQYQAHLRAANANGADVYVTVNSLRPGATGRKRADVEAVRHVFLDLDGGGREAVDRVLKAEGMPNPYHVLNTSPDKHQMIWSVEIAADPDAAIFAARGIRGITVIPPGCEAERLAGLPLNLLPGSSETAELLDAWGIRTLGELAAASLFRLNLARRTPLGKRTLPGYPYPSLDEGLVLDSEPDGGGFCIAGASRRWHTQCWACL